MGIVGSQEYSQPISGIFIFQDRYFVHVEGCAQRKKNLQTSSNYFKQNKQIKQIHGSQFIQIGDCKLLCLMNENERKKYRSGALKCLIEVLAKAQSKQICFGDIQLSMMIVENQRVKLFMTPYHLRLCKQQELDLSMQNDRWKAAAIAFQIITNKQLPKEDMNKQKVELKITKLLKKSQKQYKKKYGQYQNKKHIELLQMLFCNSISMGQIKAMNIKLDIPIWVVTKDQYQTKYKQLNQIYQGNNRNVLTVKRLKDQKFFVVKTLITNGQSTNQNYEKQIQIMWEFKSNESFVQIEEAFFIKGIGYKIIMNKCQQDLQKLISKQLSTQSKKKIFNQIHEAIYLMHQKGIVHRDIKPQNILIDVDKQHKKYKVQVADFGISMRIKSGLIKRTKSRGTLGYIAPQIVQIDKSQTLIINPQAYKPGDYYSFGVTMKQLFEAEIKSVQSTQVNEQIKQKITYLTSLNSKQRKNGFVKFPLP